MSILKIATDADCAVRKSGRQSEKGAGMLRKSGGAGCRHCAVPGGDVELIGYAIYDRPAEEWTRDAIPLDGEFMQEFACAARRLNMAVGVTLLEQYSPAPRNTLASVRPARAASIHLCQGTHMRLRRGARAHAGRRLPGMRARHGARQRG